MTTTKKKSEKKEFNISDYQVNTSTEKRTVTISETGDTFEVTIKPLSWSRRNQLISRCIVFDGAGKSSFDGDLYVRESLKEMLIAAPWGRTTEAFLVTIDTRLGAALEAIVPQAFGGDNSLEEAENIKKE